MTIKKTEQAAARASDLRWLRDLRIRYGDPSVVETIEALDEKYGIPRAGPRPGFATSWEFMELEKHILREIKRDIL